MRNTSTARKLHLVPDAPEEDHPKRWQGHDPIFFHKEQIELGTRLRYFGRIDHGTIWEVVEINTYRVTNRLQSKKMDTVSKLGDDVTVQKLGTNEWRTLRFASLSYQATWRIVA